MPKYAEALSQVEMLNMPRATSDHLKDSWLCSLEIISLLDMNQRRKRSPSIFGKPRWHVKMQSSGSKLAFLFLQE